METLGDQPVIVAQGRHMKNFVPLAVFLRRNPNLAAIRTAIAETVTSCTGLASITPKTKRVIRTEPVQMTDGRIHAVHVWCGPTDDEPPQRPIPGPLRWDLTTGEGSATTEYFLNAGMDPAQESLTGRSFVEDIPSRSLNQDESKRCHGSSTPHLTGPTAQHGISQTSLAVSAGWAGARAPSWSPPKTAVSI